MCNENNVIMQSNKLKFELWVNLANYVCACSDSDFHFRFNLLSFRVRTN